MEHTNLSDFIWSIENGTNLHICIAFLNNYGNHKTKLPWEHTIHSKQYCEFMKNQKNTLEQCVRCRNASLKRAITTKTAFGGLCCNGVYEYCYPVVKDKEVIAVIFLGNILYDDYGEGNESVLGFLDTFERNFPREDCKRLCSIVENQIKLLIEEYSDIKLNVPIVITNIKNYLEDIMFSSNISVSELALIFNYNEKYIGKLFKRYEGRTIKEYINRQRIKKAKKFLDSSEYNITEISSMVGFNNVTYFSKKFKSIYDLSPSEYKEKNHTVSGQ